MDADPLPKAALAILLVLFAGGIHAVAAWGWGRLAARRFGAGDLPAAWTIALGVAAVVLFGGVLNLLHLAHAPALLLLIAAGLALAVWSWRGGDTGRRRVDGLVWRLPLALFAAFLVWKLAPPALFNYADDFSKYLVHPQRMLASGSVAGGPFASVGAETLGAMAFLQGFAVAWGGWSMAGAVDAVFALVLLLAMIGGAWQRRGAPAWSTLLVLAAVAAFNPMAVNVSAAYLGAVLLLLLAAPLLFPREGEQVTLFAPWMGLVGAALIAVKSSFAPLVLAYALILGLFLPFVDDRRRELRRAAGAAVILVGALSPWLAASLPWRHFGVAAELPVAGELLLPRFEEQPDLWSDARVFYGFGETWRHYGVFLAVLVAVAVYHAWACGDRRRRAVLCASTLSGPLLLLPMLAFFSMSGVGADTSLRYFAAPLLVGAVVALTVTVTATGDGRRGAPLIAGLLAAAWLAGFGEGGWRRFEAIDRHRGHYAVEAFYQPAYRAYLGRQVAAKDRAAGALVNAQQSIPPGARILAFTPLAFQLDQRRNPVLELSPASLLVPWLRRPPAHEPAAWRRTLAEEGVDYLLMQRSGLGASGADELRTLAESNYFQDRLLAWRVTLLRGTFETLVAEGERAYDDGRIVAVRLATGAGRPAH